MLQELWNAIPSWGLWLIGVADVVLAALFVVWVLMTKANSASAVAWCMLLVFLPFFGMIFFLLFGYQHVERPLRRKRRHRREYHSPPKPAGYAETVWSDAAPARPATELQRSLATLAARFDASPVTFGNQVDFYVDGPTAFDAIFAAIREAKHHIHLQTFIYRRDDLGRRMRDALIAKAKEGVEVRLLYDAMGSYQMTRRFLKPLHEAGGRSSPFLPLDPLRRRFQLNMRNHRKICVVDGLVGFIGGLNVGDEYLGTNAYFGHWRDTHLRIRGPAVCDLQAVFAEDWHFAEDEPLEDDHYFRVAPGGGPHAAQIVDSGPDQELKGIREITFAAILRAKRRVWIASPYFVPDAALLDALRLAAYSGVDVRLLGQGRRDHLLTHYAGCYYWAEALRAGVRIFRYRKGLLHAKATLVDDDFAMVGSANFDNRSMFLNFEANVLLYSAEAARTLEATFERDFADSDALDPERYAARSFRQRLAENACRLFSPVL